MAVILKSRDAYPLSMDWHLIVPAEKGLAGVDLSAAREVRLRPGQPIAARLPEGVWRGETPLTPGDILRAAQALSGHSLAARNRELAKGYVPLPGGHRMGVSGRMGENGLLEITSLCVRMAHQVYGAADGCYAAVRGKSTLIVGPPGAGKTTLLRELIRLHGLEGYQVGVYDERGEIAACREGRPLLDVGPCCDVVTGGERGQGLGLLLRAMVPDVLATDEIGTAEDTALLRDALRWGVRILCTAHGEGIESVRRRPALAPLLEPGGFERVILLGKTIGTAPQVIGREGIWPS